MNLYNPPLCTGPLSRTVSDFEAFLWATIPLKWSKHVQTCIADPTSKLRDQSHETDLSWSIHPARQEILREATQTQGITWRQAQHSFETPLKDSSKELEVYVSTLAQHGSQSSSRVPKRSLFPNMMWGFATLLLFMATSQVPELDDLWCVAWWLI